MIHGPGGRGSSDARIATKGAVDAVSLVHTPREGAAHTFIHTSALGIYDTMWTAQVSQKVNRIVRPTLGADWDTRFMSEACPFL